jgi:uncharacterized caspase-like protein
MRKISLFAVAAALVLAARTRILLTVLGTLLLANSNALADERVALVIGNSKYSHAVALANPANDANAVSMMLDAAGFKVDTRNNLPNQEMRRAIREFSVKAAQADVAVVFYAGHGMEVDSNNYLVPIDAVLATEQTGHRKYACPLPP